jgi:hypothetical protein
MKWMTGIVLSGSVFLLGMFFVEGYAAYPDKSIKVIVGYEAGSSSDTVARGLYPLMEKEMGQTFMILNKPGAASALAVREIYDAKPDGYTIGISSSINVLKLQGLLPYTHRELSVLGIPSISWSVVAVCAKGPFKTIKDLVEYTKVNPGKVRMSTTNQRCCLLGAGKTFRAHDGGEIHHYQQPRRGDLYQHAAGRRPCGCGHCQLQGPAEPDRCGQHPGPGSHGFRTSPRFYPIFYPERAGV